MSERFALETSELVERLRRIAAPDERVPHTVFVHEERLPTIQATTAPLRPRLPSALGSALRGQGISQLYRHQVDTISLARSGRNVVVTTPTASGKSLCYNLPVLERAMTNPQARALYLFPTKALMADQLRAVEGLTELALPGVPVRRRSAILSGDVPSAERHALRADPPAILLANPDIVHFDILQRHQAWSTLLKNLEFVVLDELHTYRGVFGSHVSLILRRLRRIAEMHGSRPTFIATSATIANPGELAERLVGSDFSTVDGTGAGTWSRRFIFWRPPLQGHAELNEHRNANGEAVRLFVELLMAGRTVILFGRSRMAVERMLVDARQQLETRQPDFVPLISAYKGGYAVEERYRIESDLREGRLRGVIATNALELGIDIGKLDAAVIAGYPGTVMSTWQQAGRVGRRGGDEAIVVLVGADDALDQYHLSHPASFFGLPSEQAVVDPRNEPILISHLLCAAREWPLDDKALTYFPENAAAIVERLSVEGLLSASQPRRYLSDESPHRQVRIRGVSQDQFVVFEGTTQLATLERSHLYREAHPGAVFLHNGATYRVGEILEDAHQVTVRRDSTDSRTDPIVETVVTPRGDAIRRRSLRLGTGELILSIGPVTVDESVTGYKESTRGRRTAVTQSFAQPYHFQMNTVGVWLDFTIADPDQGAAVHAVEHALVNALPVALLCDRRDVGSASDEGGRIYLFDNCEGGIGLVEKLFLEIEPIATAARDLLRDCPCRDGCPSCVHLAGCGQANDQLDKHGGLALLEGRVPAKRAVESGRFVARLTAEEAPPLRDRLQKIAVDTLRERLDGAGVRVGDMFDLKGSGEVIVVEVAGPQARVRLRDSTAWTWVDQSELRNRATQPN